MIDKVSLDQLRTFLAIADQGSFSKAGRHLRRAQSAVSNSIANLEEGLGVKLFDRGEWKPTLTMHINALLDDTCTIVDRADRLKSRARTCHRDSSRRCHWCWMRCFLWLV
ncbi:helix-turn-helix domain-containing protein [Paraburkholderia haematera]|jgi:Transcriptional regulator|uniref:helix-turn-helix domain-containing protein n=1 Tax=Paraburkholderia haematera TaxID=2793077 RepID=UPI001B8D6FE8